MSASLPRGRIQLLILFIGSLFPWVGCTDESRTSGTMVQVTEEAKKHIDGRREEYKAKAKTKTRKDQSKVIKSR